MIKFSIISIFKNWGKYEKLVECIEHAKGN